MQFASALSANSKTMDKSRAATSCDAAEVRRCPRHASTLPPTLKMPNQEVGDNGCTTESTAVTPSTFIITRTELLELENEYACDAQRSPVVNQETQVEGCQRLCAQHGHIPAQYASSGPGLVELCRQSTRQGTQSTLRPSTGRSRGQSSLPNSSLPCRWSVHENLATNVQPAVAVSLHFSQMTGIEVITHKAVDNVGCGRQSNTLDGDIQRVGGAEIDLTATVAVSAALIFVFEAVKCLRWPYVLKIRRRVCRPAAGRAHVRRVQLAPLPRQR